MEKNRLVFATLLMAGALGPSAATALPLAPCATDEPRPAKDRRRAQIEAKVLAIIVEASGKAEGATLDKSFREELGIDSLEQMEMMIEVEDAFNIEIEDNECSGFSDGNDIVSHVLKVMG